MPPVLRLVPREDAPVEEAVEEELLFDDEVSDIVVVDPREALRRDVYHGLINCIVSNQALWSTVDVAVLNGVVADQLAGLPARPFALQGLWDHILGCGTPREAAAETLLLFHSRAARWGVTMTLPAELGALPSDKRARAIDRLRARGGTTGTHVGPAPQPPTTATATTTTTSPPAPAKAKKTKPPPAPPTPWPALVQRWGLRAALVATVAVGVRMADREEAGVERVRAAMSPVCQSLRFNGHVAFCTVDVANAAVASVAADGAHRLWAGDVVLVGADEPAVR